jgi:drug/metabolite transporter (DMT)-like permease
MNKMETKKIDTKSLGAHFLLLVTTFFWGITFAIVKEAVEQVGVFLFLSQRFILAFAILLAICLLSRRKFKPASLKHGIILGSLLFGGYAFQTLALVYTTASNTAFLTGLNVVFVPLIGGLMFGHLITIHMKWGVLVAAVGMFFLCTTQGLKLNVGDLLGGLCAVCVALHIICTGRYARHNDIYWLTAIQIGTVALLSVIIALWQKDRIFVWHPEILWPLIICVLFATIFAFLVQTSMQRITSPTHTALIFCMEPVFAALYAYVTIDERLGLKGLIGAILIFGGMLLAQVSMPNKSYQKQTGEEQFL